MLVAVDWSYVWATILEPGERSPFSIELANTPVDVDLWQIWVEGEKTQARANDSLTLAQVDSTLDEVGIAAFTGEVENVGRVTMTDIQVAVVVYDAAGQLIAADWVWLEGDLAPGKAMPFELQVQAGEHASSFEPYVQGRVKPG